MGISVKIRTVPLARIHLVHSGFVVYGVLATLSSEQNVTIFSSVSMF